MELQQNTDKQVNLITTINEEEIVVNKTSFNRTLIIDKDSLQKLNVNDIGKLTPEHITRLLANNPEIVILGSGSRHEFPAVELLNPIALKNIGFEVMNNQSAARTYNILVAEGRKVACLLIL